MPEIVLRQARLDDAAEIHALLLRLAPEIPLLVDTIEREEALYALIRNCARSGESWVGCDGAGQIVGCVVVEPNQLGRHYAEQEMLELRHAGAAPEYRGEDVVGRLIARLLVRMLPVAAVVNPQNRSGLAACLDKLGFRRSGARGGEQRFRWDPGAGG